ncbi:RNA-binding S4 domain-containing protein [Corynebacterium sanguinis]|uniref:RNA-binding S4 domain-containing protein n=1 Tax=Corynebacterium sanguinis TaxID=2594913 RepID=UPI00223B61B4|nr:RNA-binding S4 domain-containing protein [Corynebacterium sanguinis]MCT1805904.1 RNA-binding S4 domain-containing protein [Corynebacterium sanguinis]MCT2158655.1 RNA-binding S4 domain-containing protein [Corynebacterium sanguinis]
MLMDVDISSDSIKLGQFLKLANLAESGGQAKELIASGEVFVNGEVVTSRGHSLGDADVVSVAGTTATVIAGGGGDDYFDERTANDDFDPEKWRNL